MAALRISYNVSLSASVALCPSACLSVNPPACLPVYHSHTPCECLCVCVCVTSSRPLTLDTKRPFPAISIWVVPGTSDIVLNIRVFWWNLRFINGANWSGVTTEYRGRCQSAVESELRLSRVHFTESVHMTPGLHGHDPP